MTRFTDTPMWSAASARTSWHLYRNTARHNLFAQYASPAQSDSFAGLPPTFVSIAEFDPLRDEAWEYARRLLAAGVQTEVHLYPGTFHSSTHVVTEAAISRRALDDLHTALIRAFDRGGEVRPINELKRAPRTRHPPTHHHAGPVDRRRRRAPNEDHTPPLRPRVDAAIEEALATTEVGLQVAAYLDGDLIIGTYGSWARVAQCRRLRTHSFRSR